MKFKDAYKNEMALLKSDENPDEFVQNLYRKNKKTKRIISVKRICICAVVLICTFNLGMIASGDGPYKHFTLSVKDETFELPEYEPREFDFEKFSSSGDILNNRSGTNKEKNKKSFFWAIFDTSEMVKEYTGIQLPEENDIYFCEIVVSADCHYGIGHISTDVSVGSEDMRINGQFGIKTDKSGDSPALGYGYEKDDRSSAEKTISFGDDRKAYIVGEEDSDVKVIYFSADNIQYQLFAEKSQIDDGSVKKVLDAFYINEEKIQNK